MGRQEGPYRLTVTDTHTRPIRTISPASRHRFIRARVGPTPDGRGRFRGTRKVVSRYDGRFRGKRPGVTRSGVFWEGRFRGKRT